MLKDFESGNELYELTEQAKYYVVSDPESCAVKLRKFVECFVDTIYDRYKIDKENLDLYSKLANKVFFKAFINFLSSNTKKEIQTNPLKILHFVRIIGNKAAHNAKAKITQKDSQQSLLSISNLVSLIANEEDLQFQKPTYEISLLDFLELDNAHSFTNDQVEFFKKFDLFLKDKNQHFYTQWLCWHR